MSQEKKKLGLMKDPFQKRVWHITSGKQVVADIYLDLWDQVEEVVVYEDGEQYLRQIKELAVWHASQFVKNRNFSIMGGLMGSEVRNNDLTTTDSDNLMDFDSISEEIRNAPIEHIDSDLEQLARIVHAISMSYTDIVNRAIKIINERHGIEVSAEHRETNFSDRVEIKFTADNAHEFTFWKCADNPRSEYFDLKTELHIIPSYHPVLAGGEEVGMVNGDTDAFIRHSDHGLMSIKSPLESRTKDGLIVGTWFNLKHPFYARGKSFYIDLQTRGCLSQEGLDNIIMLIEAALNIDNKYIGISGGFQSPYDYSPNLLQRKGVRFADISIDGRKDTRGSEQDCIFEYVTLKAEGKLEGSYIPEWFFTEGWPELYGEEEPVSKH